MEDDKKGNDVNEINNKPLLKKEILANDEKEKQTLFKIFGIEMTAPKGMKNARLVYISFIVVNFILLIFIKNLISR